VTVAFEEKYISLKKLIEDVSFFLYEEEEARNLVDFFKKNARVVFSFSEGMRFQKSFLDKDTINHVVFFASNDKDRINLYRIKNIFYLIKHLIYNENYDIEVMVLFYGKNYVPLRKETADIYLKDFFSHNGEIDDLEGSPKLLFSKDIFSCICTSGTSYGPQNELEDLASLAKTWICNNHYEVKDLKSFTLECIPNAIPHYLSRRRIAQLWHMLKS
jgi:hypothetical protein